VNSTDCKKESTLLGTVNFLLNVNISMTVGQIFTKTQDGQSSCQFWAFYTSVFKLG